MSSSKQHQQKPVEHKYRNVKKGTKNVKTDIQLRKFLVVEFIRVQVLWWPRSSTALPRDEPLPGLRQRRRNGLRPRRRLRARGKGKGLAEPAKLQ